MWIFTLLFIIGFYGVKSEGKPSHLKKSTADFSFNIFQFKKNSFISFYQKTFPNGYMHVSLHRKKYLFKRKIKKQLMMNIFFRLWCMYDALLS